MATTCFLKAPHSWAKRLGPEGILIAGSYRRQRNNGQTLFAEGIFLWLLRMTQLRVITRISGTDLPEAYDRCLNGCGPGRFGKAIISPPAIIYRASRRADRLSGRTGQAWRQL